MIYVNNKLLRKVMNLNHASYNNKNMMTSVCQMSYS